MGKIRPPLNQLVISVSQAVVGDIVSLNEDFCTVAKNVGQKCLDADESAQLFPCWERPIGGQGRFTPI
jgi:hypothetical protein